MPVLAVDWQLHAELSLPTRDLQASDQPACRYSAIKVSKRFIKGAAARSGSHLDKHLGWH